MVMAHYHIEDDENLFLKADYKGMIMIGITLKCEFLKEILIDRDIRAFRLNEIEIIDKKGIETEKEALKSEIYRRLTLKAPSIPVGFDTDAHGYRHVYLFKTEESIDYKHIEECLRRAGIINENRVYYITLTW